MRLDTKIYFLKGLFGLLTSTICIILKLEGGIGLMFGILMYFLSISVIRHILRIKPSDITSPEQLYLNGLAPYLALWLLPWIVVYTFQFKHPIP